MLKTQEGAFLKSCYRIVRHSRRNKEDLGEQVRWPMAELKCFIATQLNTSPRGIVLKASLHGPNSLDRAVRDTDGNASESFIFLELKRTGVFSH